MPELEVPGNESNVVRNHIQYLSEDWERLGGPLFMLEIEVAKWLKAKHVIRFEQNNADSN